MCPIYAFIACVHCVHCMCPLYASIVCVHCMCPFHLSNICVHCICPLQVTIACVHYASIVALQYIRSLYLSTLCFHRNVCVHCKCPLYVSIACVQYIRPLYVPWHCIFASTVCVHCMCLLHCICLLYVSTVCVHWFIHCRWKSTIVRGEASGGFHRAISATIYVGHSFNGDPTEGGGAGSTSFCENFIL